MNIKVRGVDAVIEPTRRGRATIRREENYLDNDGLWQEVTVPSEKHYWKNAAAARAFVEKLNREAPKQSQNLSISDPLPDALFRLVKPSLTQEQALSAAQVAMEVLAPESVQPSPAEQHRCPTCGHLDPLTAVDCCEEQQGSQPAQGEQQMSGKCGTWTVSLDGERLTINDPEGKRQHVTAGQLSTGLHLAMALDELRWMNRQQGEQPAAEPSPQERRQAAAASISDAMLTAIEQPAEPKAVVCAGCGHDESDHCGPGQGRSRRMCEHSGCECEDFTVAEPKERLHGREEFRRWMKDYYLLVPLSELHCERIAREADEMLVQPRDAAATALQAERDDATGKLILECGLTVKLQGERDKLQGALKSERKLNVSLWNDWRALQAERDKLQGEVERLRNERDHSNIARDNAHQLASEKITQVSDLRLQLTTAQQEVERLRAALAAAEKELQDARIVCDGTSFAALKVRRHRIQSLQIELAAEKSAREVAERRAEKSEATISKVSRQIANEGHDLEKLIACAMAGKHTTIVAATETTL